MGRIRKVKDERFVVLEPAYLATRLDFITNVINRGGAYPTPANQSNPPSVTVKESSNEPA